MGNQGPAGDPSADLVFPQWAAFKAYNFDDIPGALSVHSLTFTGDGYDLSAFTGSSLAMLPGTIASNVSYSVNNIDINIDLRTSGLFIGHYFTVASGATMGLNGVINGSFLAQLIKNGPGTLAMTHSFYNEPENRYAGPTYVDAGQLFAHSVTSNALSSSSGVWVASGASLDISGNLTIGSLGGAGEVFSNESRTLTTGWDNTSTTFSGDISGRSLTLNKVGTGTFTLTDYSPNAGPVTVYGGTLEVDGWQGNSSVYVGAGGTLAGSGTVGPVTVAPPSLFDHSSGTLSPGGATTTGVLHGTGNVQFPSGLLGTGNLRVRLNGTTTYDQLSTTGSVDLTNHPNLNVALLSSQVNNQFTIVTASGPVTGMFNGLPDGQVFAVGTARFRINYMAHTVVLTHVGNAATHFVVGTPSFRQAGVTFDFTLFAVDDGNRFDPLYTGTVHFTSHDPYGASLPANYPFTAADQGHHAFLRGATLFTAGTWDVTASDTVSRITGSASVQVTAAPAVTLAIAAPASVTSGSPFDITVTAVDPYGNTDTNYQGTLTFSTSDTDPGVVLPADYSFNSADGGVHTFTDTGLGETTLITPGDQTVIAMDTQSGITGSATVNVTAGPGPPNQRDETRSAVSAEADQVLVQVLLDAARKAHLVPAAAVGDPAWLGPLDGLSRADLTRLSAELFAGTSSGDEWDMPSGPPSTCSGNGSDFPHGPC